MIGTVWLEQIDTGLFNYIQQIIQVEYYGVKSPVEVIPRYPDSDLKEGKLPCVSFYNYDQQGGKNTNREKVMVSKDTTKGTALMVNEPRKYFLYYQIDFWSKYQSDINSMTQQWITEVDNFDTIPVIDSEGNQVEANVSLVDYQNYDKMQDSDKDSRMFRRTYSYKIEATVVGRIEEIALAKGVKLNITTK